MIDINRIRENPEGVKKALAKKLWETDFTELLNWDKEKNGKLTLFCKIVTFINIFNDFFGVH